MKLDDRDNIGNYSLQVQIRLPSMECIIIIETLSELPTFFQSVFQLVDNIANSRISKETLDKCIKKRQLAAERRFKEENASRQEVS